MAYNKAKAEKEWVEWKNNEEKQLRELGVDEDTIQRLHGYDWEAFKADRRYRERNSDIEQIPDCPAQELPEVVQSVTELMYDGKIIHILYDADHNTYCDSSADDGINLKVVRDKSGNIEKLMETEAQELEQYVK